MKKDNGVFCIYPWIHLNTWPNGNVYQCCLTGWTNSIGSLERNTLEEIWNNDYMKNLRKHMIEGKKHESCIKCYEQEENGICSSRQSANKNFSEHIESAYNTTGSDGYNTDFKLVYWDFRFSNICNFKCRMCGSFLSSKWYEEEVKNGGSVIKEKVVHVKNHTNDRTSMEKYLDNFIGDVEEIYFAGGEPLLMEDHYYILNRLIDVKNTKCRIRYNTNLSKLKYKNEDCFEYWKHFYDVSIFASIDDYGKRAEYSRNGTVWNIVETNIKRILIDFPTIKFHTSTTVNIWNILYIPQIVDYLMNIGVPSYAIQLNNILTSPTEYHINILPDFFKQKVKTDLLNHLSDMDEQTRKIFINKYNSIMLFMNESPANINEVQKYFKQKTIRIDKIRNESFVDVFPELKEWFESI
jgi:radical SAM protein with 4Fe4S-binding SPASM domain